MITIVALTDAFPHAHVLVGDELLQHEVAIRQLLDASFSADYLQPWTAVFGLRPKHGLLAKNGLE